MFRYAWNMVFLVVVVAPAAFLWGSAGDIFTFIAPDSTITYDLETGEGSGTIGMLLAEDPDNPGFPNNVSGWSMGLIHDPSLLSIISVERGAYIRTLNDGDGPDFFEIGIFPNGFGIGSVYCFTGCTVCTYEEEKEIAAVTYATVPEILAGDEDGEATLLEWTEELGEPPYRLLVFAGMDIPAAVRDGVVDLVPIAFRRGDCNSDGLFDIGDPIFALNYLFGEGPPTSCDDACDTNDDGLFNIGDPIYGLGALFSGGPPPSAPFPDCGPDPSGDDLRCLVFATCP